MSFKRALGPFDATMLVIGGIVGTGIFVNPYLVARDVASPALVLGAWITGGVVALIGALAYAELGQRMPRAGGQYVYLGAAWHPIVGFLYGWALLLMIETGAMAAVAQIFAQYALGLAGRPELSGTPIAIGAIALLTVVNYAGVKPGSRVLNVLVILKMSALAALIAFAFWGAATPQWWHVSHATAPGSGLAAFGVALVPIFFTYGGWQQTNFVAEEMKNPARDLPRALVIGTSVVVAIYVLANIAYLRTLGISGLAATPTPAATVAGAWLGRGGARFMSATIAVSSFGFLDLVILTSPRVYYAMAADGAFFPSVAKLHPRFQTPSRAILLQAGWGIVLLLSGRYEDLINTVTFADWIFFALTVAGLFVLRRSAAPAGACRMPGYPWLPALFVIVSLAVVVSTVHAAPVRSAIGACLLVVGVPIYFLFRRRHA